MKRNATKMRFSVPFSETWQTRNVSLEAEFLFWMKATSKPGNLATCNNPNVESHEKIGLKRGLFK